MRTIRDIPHALTAAAEIPSTLEARGEVYMRRSESSHERRARRASRRSPNPRNAASGALRQLDSRQQLARCAFVYSGVTQGTTCRMSTPISCNASDAGLTTVRTHHLLDHRRDRARCEWWYERRPNLHFDIDGVVESRRHGLCTARLAPWPRRAGRLPTSSAIRGDDVLSDRSPRRTYR